MSEPSGLDDIVATRDALPSGLQDIVADDKPCFGCPHVNEGWRYFCVKCGLNLCPEFHRVMSASKRHKIEAKK